MAQDRLRVWIEKCIKDKKFTTGHKVENLVLFLHSTVDGIMLFSTVGGLNKSHSDEEIAEYRSMLKKSLIAVVTGN